MLNSAFIDAMDEDLSILERFNKLARNMAPEQRKALNIAPVDVLIIKPTIKFDQLAQQYEHLLPQSMRFLLSIIGANRKGSGTSLASYVLFEKAYCQALIESGYQDAMRQADEIRSFLDIEH